MAEPLVPPKPAPPLNIPESSSTVTVRVIDTTSTVHAKMSVMVEPAIKGHDDLNCPSWSFLITHGERHFLFDLGIRKDWQNLPPAMSRDRLGPGKPIQPVVEKNVVDILEEDPGNLGIKPKDVEAIFWSHHHFDHTGCAATFPASTAVIVGPGFKEKLLPFYPTNPKSVLLESDVEGREFREIDIASEGKGLRLGRCEAFDFFGDGSFYLFSTPGHAPGHVCGLARLTTSPSTFVLMGGDAVHHTGEFRPSQYLPLPSSISPSPIPKFRPHPCPGELLQHLQRNDKPDEPFYRAAKGSGTDLDQTLDSVGKLIEFDADPNVLIVYAHDAILKDQLDLYPKTLNDWKAKDLDARTRWLFVKDFKKAFDNDDDDDATKL